MEAKIYISGRISKGETLKDVIRQYKSFDNPDSVTVEIDSNGGSKDEGDAIYNYLSNLDLPVTTKTKKAYSIAAKIFAAGDTRIVEDEDEVLMIHFASATVERFEGTAEDYEAIAEELKEIKKEFITFYSSHLDIDKDTVETLLDNETFVSGKEAVELGFATEVLKPVEVVAELTLTVKNKNKMNDKKSFLSKLVDEINSFLIKDEKDIVSELVLQDSTGTEIVFPSLESDSTPAVGDKATIDGSTIPDGSYIMPSLEDKTLVFEGGAITEIKEKEEEEETEDATETTAETEAKEVTTWTMRLVNDSFALGDVVKYYDWEENEATIGAAELVLPSGDSIVTDAAGIIVKIKEGQSAIEEVPAEAEAIADPTPEPTAEINLEQLIEKVTEKVAQKITAEFKAEIEKKDKEIKALKSKIGTPEPDDKTKEPIVKKMEDKGAARYLRAAYS